MDKRGQKDTKPFNLATLNRRINHICNGRRDIHGYLEVSPQIIVWPSELNPGQFGCIGLFSGVHYFIEPIQPEV